MPLDPILQRYIEDKSIPFEKRKNMADDLDSGSVDTETAKGIVMQKYPNRFNGSSDSSSQGAPPAPLANPEAKAMADKVSIPYGAPKEAALGFNAMMHNQGAEDYLAGKGQEIKDAANQDLNMGGLERVLNIGKGALTGLKDTAVGLAKVPANLITQTPAVIGAVKDIATGNYRGWDSPLNEADRKSIEESQGGIEGINQSIGGVSGVVTSPLAASPLLQKTVSLPFEAAHDLISGTIDKLGVDTKSQTGKNITDSIFNGILLAMGAGKDIVKQVKKGELSLSDAWEKVKETPAMAKEIPSMARDLIKSKLPTGETPIVGKSNWVDRNLVQPISAEAGKFSQDTTKMAMENPDLLTKAQKEGVDANRSKTFDMVRKPLDERISTLETNLEKNKAQTFDTAKNAIDTELQNLSETGSGYEPIKKQKGTISLADKNGNSWFENFVQSKGLKIEDGKIVASKSSAIRNPGEIARLNGLYENYGKYTDFTPSEFLNFRQDVAGLAGFGEGISPGMKPFAREFYTKLNEKGRPQIQGLEALDAEFSTSKKNLKEAKKLIYDKEGSLKPNAYDLIVKAVENGKPGVVAALKKVIPEFDKFYEEAQKSHGIASELKQFKQLIYDSDGNIKSNAISEINNLFNKGKEGKLARVQEIMPEFEQFQKQVKITKALEDIQAAKTNRVGFYKRATGNTGAGALGYVAGGGPVGAGVAILLHEIITNPTVVLETLKGYGKLKIGTERLINNISSLVDAGKKLSPDQISFLAEHAPLFGKDEKK